MENKENNLINPLDSQCIVKISFSDEERLKCFISIKKKVMKLLFLIEEEQQGKIQIDQWFYGFMFELASSNKLCDNELTDIVIKMHGLYDNCHYKEMTHDQIKRQIMESKGIIEHMIEKVEERIDEKKKDQQR